MPVKQKIWHHLMTALGAAVLLAVTVFILSRWKDLPEQLPTNFNARGVPDAYGSKSGLVTLLAIGWLGFLLTTVLSFFPQLWKTHGERFRLISLGGFRVNAQGAGFSGARTANPRDLAAMTDMLAVTRLILAVVFGWLSLCVALDRSLGLLFFPVMLGALVLNLVVLLVRTRLG